jgi:hypothetical protein
MKTGINRTLEAVEFESGFVHLYAARCSNLKRMLPLCTDWEVFFSYIYFLQKFSFIMPKPLRKCLRDSYLYFRASHRYHGDPLMIRFGAH